MKFRRKISVVEAYHFTEESIKHSEDWPNWLLESCNTNYKHGCYFYETLINNPYNDTFTIQYSNGSITCVNYGDWIVNSDGKLTALSPEEFHNIYEQIDWNDCNSCEDENVHLSYSDNGYNDPAIPDNYEYNHPELIKLITQLLAEK